MRLVLFIVAILGTTTGLARSQMPSALEIGRAWADREQRLKSGQIEWTKRTLHTRGSMTQPSHGDRTVPEQDTTIESTNELVWDGHRMSYRHEGETLALDGSKFVPWTHRSVTGGWTGSRTLYNGESLIHPMGVVVPPVALENREGIELIPLLLWARPLDARGCAIEIAKCRLLPRPQEVDGRSLVVLEQTRPTGTSVHRWFVDPERDFVVVRHEGDTGGKTKFRVDLDYGQDSDGAWIPSGWRTLWFDGRGELSTEHTATVTKCDVGIAVEADQFDLEFPRGAWIGDQVRNIEYIVTGPGAERIVTPGELSRGVSYRDLLNSESGLAGTAPRPQWRAWILAAATATLVASLAVAVVKKVRQSRPSR